jgi:hypothetical protein
LQGAPRLAFESYFKEIIKDDDHREIKGKDFALDYFIDDEMVSNEMVSLIVRTDYLN